MRLPGKMMRQVLSSVFRKPATVPYPFVKAPMPANFRGKLTFDSAKCIGCKLCERDCPTGAIRIEKVADKTFEAHFDFASCIYCAQCVDSCPKKAIQATGEFELAATSRQSLQQVFHAQPKAPAAAPQADAPQAAPKDPSKP
jgi:formate hydrogenlyase subunit 6/NADH:ubiquinone oxidoreductase subunit I